MSFVLGLVLLLMVAAGVAIATPWGQCEWSYWTEFHADRTVSSAAELAPFYPNPRALEAEDFIYGQCTTAAASREYQRLFPTGRYLEKVKKLDLDPRIWQNGNEGYGYRVKRLALDFLYKGGGPECTYGKIRYRSHYR